MATPTPWQVAGGGRCTCGVTPSVTVKVFSRGTEPWPYYQPPVPVDSGTTQEGAGGYGDINGGPGGGYGDNSGGSGGTGGLGGTGGSSGGSAACPCGNTDGAGGAAPGP